ncbi:hypothetical protein Ahy_B06g085236 [Arachis hypogaea]|uniref:RING-type E3 ubiquitin transferase n=1 Tax=Arachis hypogaea TaxID=3818 RepID=A0A444YTW4_ARAHY|nr:hypothetical protein Ahy_B06g085236 [Arachis hypogaea]
MFRSQNFSILLLVLFLAPNSVTVNCRCTDKCGRIKIQFPFHLKNSNLNQNATYLPGFELSCNDKHQALLKLPKVPSVSFFVKQIDYKSQQIQIYHPNNCLASQLLALGNSSTSPFRFISPYYGGETSYSNVSFFSCASSSSYSCPILQLDSSSFIIDPGILSCTKVRDVLSVQWRFTDDDETSLFLGWSNPNCGQCEAQGKKCRLKSDGTKEEIECFVCKTNKISTSTLVLIVAGKDIHIDIDNEGDMKIAKKLAIVGLWCIQWNPVDRPSMKTVVQMLEREGDKLTVPPTPFDSTTSSSRNNNNAVVSSRHLNFELEVIPELE